jgi:hypothetical protein
MNALELTSSIGASTSPARWRSNPILDVTGCYETRPGHQSPDVILPDWPRADLLLGRDQGRYTGHGLAEAMRSSVTHGIDAARLGAWSVYLQSLAAPRGPLTPVEAMRVRRFWQLIRREAPGLPTPHALARVDGYFGMTWDSSKCHLEIELFAAATYEWFFVDHESGETDGEEDLVTPVLSPNLTWYLQSL